MLGELIAGFSNPGIQPHQDYFAVWIHIFTDKPVSRRKSARRSRTRPCPTGGQPRSSCSSAYYYPGGNILPSAGGLSSGAESPPGPTDPEACYVGVPPPKLL